MSTETREAPLVRDLTVDEAFSELRQAFPDTWIQIEVSDRPVIGRVYMVRVYGQKRQGEWLRSLSECVYRATHGRRTVYRRLTPAAQDAAGER